MRDNGGGYSTYHAGLGAGQVKPRTTDQGTTTNLTLQGGTQTFGAAEPKKVPIPWLLIGALARTVFDTGNIPANEFLNHYTTLAGWKGILSAGFISTSRDKFVYLTSNYFPSGSLARSALSLNQTPIGYFRIDAAGLLNALPPRVVAPANGGAGGGIEIRIPYNVPISGASWHVISP